MFNYPWEYFQLPSGVLSTTLEGIFKYPRIFGNIVKSKCFARGCLKKVRKISSENAGEDLPAAAARCRPPPDPPTVGRPLRPSPPPTGGRLAPGCCFCCRTVSALLGPPPGSRVTALWTPRPLPSVTRVTGFIKSASLFYSMTAET